MVEGGKEMVGASKKVVGGQNFGKKVEGVVKYFIPSTFLNGIALSSCSCQVGLCIISNLINVDQSSPL